MMQYKGDDLDLRVPHTRTQREVYVSSEYDGPQGGQRLSRGAYAGNGEPLWVDEILLQCCNYAFDIAAANGAGEVGLEHLINALTRVEGAARILEARGVREAQLRRESATLIASEVPVSGGGERVTPRRGPDFEDIMRRAVDQAGRRGTAANVDDVLWVILHHNREMPAVLLLRRLTPDWQRLDWGRGREVVVQTVAAEPQRMSVASGSFETFSGRIAQIEDSLRGLHADLAAERKVLADLIRDAQRDIVAQRGDAASLRSDLAQRLEALERSMQSRTDTSRLTVQLSDRIQTLEKAVHGGLGEGARNWAALGQRLQTIEASLEERTVSTFDAAPLMDRLTSIEQALNGRIEASARVWNGFAERLQSVERLVEAGAGDGSRNLALVVDKMSALETTVRAMPVNSSVDLAPLQDRMSEFEGVVRSGFGDVARMSAVMTDRLDAIERRPVPVAPDHSEALLILDDRMQSIERMMQDRSSVQTAMPSFDPIVAELRDASGRINSLEQKVISSASASELALQARDLDVKEMHEAIVRLSENQLTLASAIADWRHECHNDFNAINAQIEKMVVAPPPLAAPVREQPASAPIVREPMPAAFSDRSNDTKLAVEITETKEDQLYVPPIEEQRGHGFWWWLFGTSSVSKANRDAEIRWQRMHNRLKEARERRRERA